MPIIHVQTRAIESRTCNPLEVEVEESPRETNEDASDQGVLERRFRHALDGPGGVANNVPRGTQADPHQQNAGEGQHRLWGGRLASSPSPKMRVVDHRSLPWR